MARCKNAAQNSQSKMENNQKNSVVSTKNSDLISQKAMQEQTKQQQRKINNYFVAFVRKSILYYACSLVQYMAITGMSLANLIRLR